MSPAVTDAARRRHYGAFYELEPVPAGPILAAVHGNCQAESLRVALAGPDLATVRLPPVHELEVDDLPYLQRILGQVDVLISQPVRDGYRDLPLGHGQLSTRLSAAGQMTLVPVIRFAGLYPAHAIIRPPSDRSATPPLVAYHDLRILARAAGYTDVPALSPAKVRQVAAFSRQELRRRELLHQTVAVSDLFGDPRFEQMRTINHPGNPVVEAVAGRVRAHLGLGDGVPLSRPLLHGVHAPREPAVIEAFNLQASPQPCWLIDGEPIDPAELLQAHLAWYRRHPDAVEAGLRRHAPVLQILLGR
jgi:hypothetical protein